MASTEESEESRIEDFDAEVERLLNRGRNKPRVQKSSHQAPEFTKRLNSFEEVKAGETAIFECTFSAFPDANVKWFKDDQDISEDGRYLFKELEAGTLQLKLDICSKEDEGAYKCKMENTEGVASSTGYLSVTGKIEDKILCKQPRKSQSEHVISAAPPLRSIREQKSMEEREGEATARQPPSPLKEFMRHMYRNKTWPLSMEPPEDIEDLDGGDDGSETDTSVASQDSYQNVTFNTEPHDEVFEEEIIQSQPNAPCHSIPEEANLNTNTEQHSDIPEQLPHNGLVEATNSNGELYNRSRHLNGGSVNRTADATAKSNLHVSAKLRGSLPDLSTFAGLQLDFPMMFFLTFITAMTSYAAATGISPTLFVLIIAAVSVLCFILFQLKQAGN